MTVLTLTTGTTLVMWLGEQITERGIGNGMSLIIYAGIVVSLPQCGHHDLRSAAYRTDGPDSPARPADRHDFVVAAIIFVERGSRRITVQYAKRVGGPADVRRREHRISR
jgi:preprotein translocase subunit SecY